MILRKSNLIPFLIAILFGATLWTACDDAVVDDGIPQIYINEVINLDDFQFQTLRNIGGHVYLNEGVRGIILYRSSLNEYTAFERNCTFQPMSDCALVSVDESTLFMLDSCCNSTFDFGGYPTGGPAQIPLRIYNTFLNGNLLTITSDAI